LTRGGGETSRRRTTEIRTVTLRNLPPALGREIRRRAEKTGTSLARAVIQLLEERLGLSRATGRETYHDLDELAGSWTEADARAFEDALAEQRRIDARLWE